MRKFLLVSITLVTGLVSSGTAATITGTVTNQVSGDSLSGVTLVLSIIANPRVPVDTVTSNASGMYAFLDVDQGEYAVTATRTGYITASSMVRVTGTSQTVTNNIALIPMGQGTIGAIRGTVRDSVNNLAIGGVTMILAVRGTGGQGGGGLTPVDTVATSATGTYLFSGIPASTRYVVTAIAAGYAPQEQNQVTVTANDTTVVNFRLVALIGAKGSIVGTVRDSISSALLANAQVILRFGITGGGSGGSVIWTAVDTVTTATNGAFSFGDLAPNTNGNFYSVVVAASGYRTWSSSNITVAANETDTVNVLLRRLVTGVTVFPAFGTTGRTTQIRYVNGSLVFGSAVGDATICLFSLSGRELYRSAVSAGVDRVILPQRLTGTAARAIVSIRGSDVSIGRMVIVGR